MTVKHFKAPIIAKAYASDFALYSFAIGKIKYLNKSTEATLKLIKNYIDIIYSELDTALIFFHVYQPFDLLSISNTFTGNNGGAYQTNDFFKRNYNSDFSLTRSFDAYWLTPSQIKYFQSYQLHLR